MTAVLNQLLEQATERSTELAERAATAEDEVEQVLKGAHALTDLALQHSEALHQDFADAMQAVDNARTEVEAEAGRTDLTLDGLPARADTTETKARELLEGVRQDTADLAELRSRLATRLDDSAREVGNEFQDLGRRVDTLRQTLDGSLKMLDFEAQELVDSIEKGQAQLADEEQPLREAIQSLGVLATDKAQAFAASLHAVLLLLGRNVVDVSNNILKSHNGALKSLRTGLTDEEPGAAEDDQTWVHEVLQPIRDAVAELALVPEPARQVLEQVGGIVLKATQASHDLADIARALEEGVPAVQGA